MQHLKKNYDITQWLPTTKKEAELRGWDKMDVILFSGDAYVDHPAFGHAIIGRIIESEGLRVAIVTQPNWKDDLRDFTKFGKPRYFFGVTSGCMDSMVNHYTANKRLRSDDAYTPGNKAGFRPDYATIVYCNILKRFFPEVPIIIGGIEASMRRFSHYDYWSNSVMPSILVDCKADLLVYGMGEKGIREIVEKFKQNIPFDIFKEQISQTAFLSAKNDSQNAFILPSHEACVKSKKSFAEAFCIVEELSNCFHDKVILQKTGLKTLVVNPPYPLMSTAELDAIYRLPFTRLPHPKYRTKGDIPAYKMIQNSVTIHRGCFGGCSFCTISMHQGKHISSRSESSILEEISQIKEMDDFSGTISDLGGPSANMYQMKGKDDKICTICKRTSCLYPQICKNLNSDHKPLLDLYRKVRKLVQHVYIGSGIRYDLFLSHSDKMSKELYHDQYFNELFLHHTGGRLKVAPEHVSPTVLQYVRKPGFEMFEKLKIKFENLNIKYNKKFQLIPYFISSLPACRLEEMELLMQKTRKLGYRLEQVQDFTPTPMTMASTLYYCGFDPYSQKKVYCAKTKQERSDQQRYFFWYKPENAAWIQKNKLHPKSRSCM